MEDPLTRRRGDDDSPHEERIALQDIRRKVKGALAELSIALLAIDRLMKK